MRATSLKTKSFKRTHTRNLDKCFEPSANRHKPAKMTRNRIPPPERELIVQMSAAGNTITDISKKVQRNRETVSRIVRGPEMQTMVRQMRERFFALAPDAIGAVQHALTQQKDGRLALQLLSSIGVTPSPEEKVALSVQQVETQNDPDSGVKKIMADLIEISIERAKIFGYRDLELEEQLRTVGGKINYTEGKIEPLKDKTTT